MLAESRKNARRAGDAFGCVDQRAVEEYWEEVVRSRRKGIRCLDPLPDAGAGRRRWVAMCLRRAYDLEWVPEHVAEHIVSVDWHQSEAMILMLDTGTRLIDRFDRIDVIGTIDDIAVDELVACVQRRGWQRVKLSGSDDFRVDAARALLVAGIEVESPPLFAAEVEMLRAQARLAPPRPA